MKPTFSIFLILFVSLMSIAQNNSSYVEVPGHTVYQKTVDKYRAEMQITTVYYDTYYEEEKPELEKVEAEVFEKLKTAGFDKNRFTKIDKISYSPQPQSEQSFYIFETNSKDEFTKFITLRKIRGVHTTANRKIYYKPLENKKKLVDQALENARSNASIIASSMGKTLGDILSVSDCNTMQPDNSGYFPAPENHTYRLSVKFVVE